MASRTLGACVRCFIARAATTIERLTFGGATYDLALCEQHANMMMTDMTGWTRCGTIVDDAPQPPPPATFTPVKTSTPLRSPRELVAIPKARPAPPPAALKVPVAPEEPVAWFTADEPQWHLSIHALERIAERDIPRIDALWCAEHPDVTRPGKQPGTFIHVRGSIHVVTAPQYRTILTVWNRNFANDAEMELDDASSVTN